MKRTLFFALSALLLAAAACSGRRSLLDSPVPLAVLFQQGHIVLYREQILLIALAVALLLVSPIRMFALKFTSFSPKGNMLRYGFLLTSLLLIIFCTTYSVTLIIVLYIVVSPLRWIVGHSTEDRS